VRRLKLQVQTTIDGYMAGPQGEMDWMTMPWSDDLNAHVDALTASVDTIVLGRRLAEGFIPTWAAGPEGEDAASIEWMNSTPKVVFSRTLTASPWENAEIANGDLATEVAALKARSGAGIIVYGGATLVRDLLAADLIDDLHLFVNPAAIGAGLPVFPGDGTPRPYRLAEAQPFTCGVTALHYELDRR
jgi:dihydrofolate reductase